MEEPLVNRVQESGLIQLDLSRELQPRQVDVVDVSQWLDQGFVLREKDFRDSVKRWDASATPATLWPCIAPPTRSCRTGRGCSWPKR